MEGEYVGHDDEQEAADNGWPNREQIDAMLQEFQAKWTPHEEHLRYQFSRWRQAAPHCPGPLAEILRDHK